MSNTIVYTTLVLSVRTDHELQETILHHRSISTGTDAPSTIFETGIDPEVGTNVKVSFMERTKTKFFVKLQTKTK